MTTDIDVVGRDVLRCLSRAREAAEGGMEIAEMELGGNAERLVVDEPAVDTVVDV